MRGSGVGGQGLQSGFGDQVLMIWFMGYGLDDKVSGQGARSWGSGVRGLGFTFAF